LCICQQRRNRHNIHLRRFSASIVVCSESGWHQVPNSLIYASKLTVSCGSEQLPLSSNNNTRDVTSAYKSTSPVATARRPGSPGAGLPPADPTPWSQAFRDLTTVPSQAEPGSPAGVLTEPWRQDGQNRPRSGPALAAESSESPPHLGASESSQRVFSHSDRAHWAVLCDGHIQGLGLATTGPGSLAWLHDRNNFSRIKRCVLT
jgi:hypothetical protein